MSTFRKCLLAGAAVALTATAAWAATAHYGARAAPLAAYVSPDDNLNYAVFTAPVPAAYVTPDAMFAQMDQIMAGMNRMERAMDAQMQQAFAGTDEMIPMGQDRLMNAVLTGAPSGDAATLDAALKNGDACMQSVSITQNGNEKPQMVSHSYGNCGAAGNVSGTQAATPALQPAQPGLIEASLLTAGKKHKKHPA